MKETRDDSKEICFDTKEIHDFSKERILLISYAVMKRRQKGHSPIPFCIET